MAHAAASWHAASSGLAFPHSCGRACEPVAVCDVPAAALNCTKCLPQVSGPALPQGAPSPVIAAPALPALEAQPQLERNRPAREDSLHSGRVHSSAQGWRHASSVRPHWDGPDWRPGRYAGELTLCLAEQDRSQGQAAVAQTGGNTG